MFLKKLFEDGFSTVATVTGGVITFGGFSSNTLMADKSSSCIFVIIGGADVACSWPLLAAFDSPLVFRISGGGDRIGLARRYESLRLRLLRGRSLLGLAVAVVGAPLPAFVMALWLRFGDFGGFSRR